MKALRGKRAFITGAATGIGRAIALGLAREGVNLVLLDVDVEGLNKVAESARQAGVDVMLQICDLCQPREIAECLDEIRSMGGVDIVVNNAGVAAFGPTDQMTDESWDRVLAINLHAPIQIVRELLPSLLERDEAHILNICSLAGLVAGGKLAAYNVSKFGLQGLSESLRAEYGRSGLGVTSLCPGFTSTNIFEASRRISAPGRKSRIPPKWLMTTPEQVAARAIRAIRWNQPLVVVTWFAKMLWFLKRMAPSLFLRLFTRKYRKARSAAAATAEQPIRRLSA